MIVGIKVKAVAVETKARYDFKLICNPFGKIVL